MTKYFEVTKRDAAARIGRLMLDKQYQTPFILHAGAESPIVYAGTLWARNTLSIDQVEPDKLVILPDKPMPLHLEQNKVEKILQSCTAGQQAWEDRDGALGRIIHPAMQEFSPADLYVLGASGQFENNARALVDTVIKVRNNTPPDTALYTPALATPDNLALLVYLGIDIVDINAVYKRTDIPCIVVMRDYPDFERIYAALEHLPDTEMRWELIKRSGEIYKITVHEGENPIYIQHSGIDHNDAKKIVKMSAIHSNIPEPLRAAHLIATGIVCGESTGRA